MTYKSQVQLKAAATVFREKFNIENFVTSEFFLILVESGSFSFESKTDKYIVSPGECAHFKRDVMYFRKIIEPAKIHLFRYQSDVPLVSDEYLAFTEKSRITSTMNLLKTANSMPSDNEMDYKKHLLLDIINQYNMENEFSYNSTNYNDPLIKNIILRMKKDLSKNLTITEYAQETKLSYVQFLRRFKAYTGLCPIEFINTLRIQEAKNMLTEGNLKIKEISERLGFENEYYFSNFFKKQLKMSPSAFRKMDNIFF